MLPSFPAWTRTLGDRELSVTLAWPAVALIGLTLAVAGALWLLVLRGPRSPWLGGVVGLAFGFGAAIPGGAAILAATLLAGGAETFAVVLRPLIVAEGATMIVAGVIGGAGIAAHLARGGGELGLPTLLAGALVTSGVLLTGAGAVQGLDLAGLGEVPTFSTTSVSPVHVGHTLDLQPVLVRDGLPLDLDQTRWSVPSTPFRGDVAGSRTVTAEAHRGSVTLRQPVTVDVGTDRGDPLFPLVVGNHWTWQSTTESGAQVLWVLHTQGSSDGDRYETSVVAESDDGPLHTFTLRTVTVHPAVPAGEPDQPGTPETRESEDRTLFRWNATVREWRTPVDAPPEASPALERLPDSGWTSPDGQPLVACSFALLPSDSCGCRVDAPGALAGPAICRRTTGGGVMRSLGTGLLAALTAGLVILDTEDHTTLVLVDAGGRPESARQTP